MDKNKLPKYKMILIPIDEKDEILLENVNNENNIKKARSLCKEVRKLADKYNMSFFFVTEGASAYNNMCNSQAIRNARNKHIEWELANNSDPYEDWSKK